MMGLDKEKMTLMWIMEDDQDKNQDLDWIKKIDEDQVLNGWTKIRIIIKMIKKQLIGMIMMRGMIGMRLMEGIFDLRMMWKF